MGKVVRRPKLSVVGASTLLALVDLERSSSICRWLNGDRGDDGTWLCRTGGAFTEDS